MTNTRTNAERMEKIEAEQMQMKEQLATANMQLTEITASLAELSRAILKDSHTERDSSSETEEKQPPILPRGTLSPLQLPTFNGSDPIGWLARANQQFEIYGTSTAQKVALAVVAMEDSALYWVTWLRSRKPELTWEEFSQAIVARFDTRFKGSSFERLADVKQSGSVDDYINLFVQLASQVPGLTDAHYMGYFMKGLSDSVRSALRLLRPGDLETAMELARDVEDNLALQSGGRASNGVVSTHNRVNSYARPTFGTNSGSGSTTGNRGSPGVSYGAKPTPSSAPGQNPNRPRFTRLSPNDYADLRAKGLCFRCKKPYTPGHECPLKQLRVLLAEEDEVLDFSHVEGMEIAGPDDPLDSNEGPEGGDGSLPLCSMAGISGPRTMRLCGVVRGRTVTVLIDSGASHNFISAALVPMLKLEPDRTCKFGVQLGDGRRQESEGVCREVCVSLPGCEVVADCYVFALGGVDIILGVAWLATLGDVRINWETMTMKFVWKETSVELHGDPTLCRGAVGLKALVRTQDGEFWAVLLQREPENSVVEEPARVGQLLQEFEEVFGEPMELPPRRTTDHRIELTPGAGPVSVRPYRYGHVQKDEIERLVADMLIAGIIRPSSSPFSSPVLLVKKKDGSWRFCVDYRELNKVTVPDKYPIPVIQEMLDELAGAVVYSKIDLRSGYHQIRVAESDIPKTAFRTHSGHYEFLVMPFGLTNAPATFQSTMNDLFRPWLRKFVPVFFDDILVYSRSWEKHRQHLVQVLQTLKEHQFKANRKKCSFDCSSVEYLGHIISQAGVAMDPSKVRAVVEWPRPQSVRDVRGFLGLTGYYRRFVQSYGLIAQPLTILLKKAASAQFEWSKEAEAAFQRLKKALTEAPVLAMPDFSRAFVVECDASGTGVGAVLMQEKRPIAYFSKPLSERNLSKSTYEREMMGLVLAVQHWRPYLMGRHFVVRTDHSSLKHLLSQKIVTPAQQIWVAKLLGYDFTIEYKSGISNAAADALSRRGEEGLLAALSGPEWLDMSEVLHEQEADAHIQGIVQAIKAQPGSRVGFEIHGGRLFYKGRVVLATNSAWIPRLLHEFHDTPIGGHAGAFRTYRRLALCVYWKGMFRKVQEYVAQCLICQKSKYEAMSPAGLLQPLPIPELIWEDLSMDFITCLPKSRGYSVIMVVVDRLSKYGHFVALKPPVTARSAAECFMREVVRLHGIPRSIVSDRDPVFVSAFWRELFTRSGTQLKFSTAYHPETDGQTEVLNRVVETYLRCFTCEQPKQWTRWLPWAEYWYNTAYQTAAQLTPFEVVYGRKPPTIQRFLPGECRVAAVADELESRDAILLRLKESLMRAQQQMVKYANRRRRLVEFEVGDRVFLKVRPFRQTSVSGQQHHKLAAKFYGPFEVEKRVGPTAYQLKLPASSRIHPVFHVSQLRRVVGEHPVESELPGSLELPVGPVFEPEAVLDSRKVAANGGEQEQVLIKWVGQPVDDATWVEVDSFHQQFPDFHLGDKVVSKGEGVVRERNDEEVDLVGQVGPRPLQVYRRRGRA